MGFTSSLRLFHFFFMFLNHFCFLLSPFLPPLLIFCTGILLLPFFSYLLFCYFFPSSASSLFLFFTFPFLFFFTSSIRFCFHFSFYEALNPNYETLKFPKLKSKTIIPKLPNLKFQISSLSCDPYLVSSTTRMPSSLLKRKRSKLLINPWIR